MVLARDKHICHYCDSTADRMTFLLPRSQGGHLSPKNSVAVCRTCKDTHGENLYFFKWLNVPVVNHENLMQEKTIYAMWDKERQTQFRICKEDAQKLMAEAMAEEIGENSIWIKYNQKEFWDLIRSRDHFTCHYCHKYGDTVDHIIPKSKGGMSTAVNCVCACDKCNERKSDLEKDVFIEKRKSN